MTKKQAEWWNNFLNDFLKNRKLISVTQIHTHEPEIRIVVFDHSYIIDYKNDSYSIGLSDSYGVMTGSESWSINPDRKEIIANAKNGYGQQCWHVWKIFDDHELEYPPKNNENVWEKLVEKQKESWKIK